MVDRQERIRAARIGVIADHKIAMMAVKVIRQ